MVVDPSGVYFSRLLPRKLNPWCLQQDSVDFFNGLPIMPTYEYRCPDGHTFELFQRMSDPPAADCPECGKGAERLLSSGAGFLFKGGGFYITDYRSDSYKKAAEADKGKAPGSSEGGSSPESKPAPAPSETKTTPSTPSSGASTGGNSKSD